MSDIEVMELDEETGVAAQPSERRIKRHKRRVRRKVLLAIFLLFVIAYLLGVIYFGTHFVPGTTIGDKDYSFCEFAQAKEELIGRPTNITIELVGKDGEKFTFNTDDVGMTYDIDESAFFSGADYIGALKWPLLTIKRNKISVASVISYDEDEILEYLKKQPIFDTEKSIAPVNASIGEYDKATRTFSIKPEVAGTRLDVKLACAEIEKELADPEELKDSVITIDLIESDCYKKPTVLSDSPELLAALDAANTFVKTDIVYDWNGAREELNGDTIAAWIVSSGTKVAVDPIMIQNYVADMAATYDTYNRYMNFTCADGSVKSLKRGDYGWKTNREAEAKALTEAIMNGEQTERTPVFANKGYVVGQNDIGNSYVEVNMSSQHLYLHVDGAVVYECPVVTGDMATGCQTPTGIFGVTYKKSEVTLRGETWEDFVYYWMPFFQSYGLHDATWRNEFGGDIFTNNGSHGCVNLPLDAAEVIYNTVTENFPVVCYY